MTLRTGPHFKNKDDGLSRLGPEPLPPCFRSDWQVLPGVDQLCTLLGGGRECDIIRFWPTRSEGCAGVSMVQHRANSVAQIRIALSSGAGLPPGPGHDGSPESKWQRQSISGRSSLR